ncbi:MAG: hypothetical protein HIU88_04705 [Acidobacteria bacterium]|nr:hypothetical protein [Acidobacteriota bacterium]
MTGRGDDAPRRLRRPIELLVVTALGVIAGGVEIVIGVLVIFARYLPSVAQLHAREVVTLLGSGLVLVGLLTAAVSWGLTRGDRSARVIVTVLLGIGIVFNVAAIVADRDDLLVGLVPLVLAVTAAIVMWTGRTARYFARQAA